jgi:DNA-binding HxlR family transcriptional regulator
METAMDERGGYGQFCPVALASEILCSRWTTLVVRELLSGSTRFNDLRRGVPKMSPALLSKRLKELQKAGIVAVSRKPNGSVDYRLSESGEELRPLIMGLGNWAQRWVESRITLKCAAA